VNSERIIKTARTIVERFPKVHSDKDPFRVLITTILSQRSKDENTEIAADRLFSTYGKITEIASKEPEQLYDLVRPAGIYRQKSKRIIEVSRILLEKYSGKVPENIDELTKLPGVGRKTANIVLWVSFSVPALAVDTHVHRIANRLGWIKTRSPEKSEYALMKVLPGELWGPVNGAMVEFGKAICKPRRPLCRECPVKTYCDYYAAERNSVEEETG